MPVRILHLHSTFAPGGKETRAVRLMNAFGRAADHVVVSAVPEALGARDGLAPAIRVEFPAATAAPSLTGTPGLARYWRMARYMAGFDLVLTYNWGAMDGVMAHRLYAGALRLPPLVHHEDGFNTDEVVRLKRRRSVFRSWALGTAHALVVPSERLERIARERWGRAARHVRRIANGIELDAFLGPPAADSIPGFRRQPGDVIVGTCAGLRPVKNLPRLVRAFAAAGGQGRLLIVGDGPERAAILAAAQAAGVAERLLMPGHLADPARFIGHFDIFALSSDSEQFPLALVEAMAACLPVVATDVGDVARMVAPENRRCIVPPQDEAGFAAALGRLMASRDLRHRLGTANRARAQAAFGEAAMIEAYRGLYCEAMGSAGALG